ncbi:hypothetical protein [Azospirillum sp.]|uniref:hypothetical protein n=1 Tax=Azospirillum sp. TaxID=34012 RepID=UPI002D35B4AF|nr:hypothetical protein [Azospirillum sp.]HYD66999.1 hypothetical protein [Azospirillum sp.]
MITKGYYASLRELLATGDPARVVAKIGFGTGTNPEDFNDTTLTNAFVKPLSGFEMDPDNPRLLRFTYSLLRGEANGKAITEIGLFTEGGTLVARKVRSPIEKTPDMQIGDTWELLV